MLKKFLQDETGAELAEYAVGVALLVAIGIVVYKGLGDAVNVSNSTTGSNIQNAKYPYNSRPAGSGLIRLQSPFSYSVERSTVMNFKESFRTLLIDEQGAELAEY